MGRAGPEGQLYLPPGFRFYPTDEELVVHYLCKKAASQPFAVPVIAEIDLYKFDPWDLPEKALFACGYWKATGTDKPIMSGGTHKVGVKKALVFYIGKAPKGTKTNWIMHEYRLADGSSRAAKRKGSLRLDDWVLCRIYKKSSGAQKAAAKDNQSSCLEEVLASLPDIDDSRLMNMNPFKLLNMGEKPNPILFDQPDDHMTDNVSRCAGHGNELCTAWRNSVPNSSFLGFTNKEQNSNVACTDGETAGVTEVGSSRGYAIDAHDPTVPIEIAIQNGYNYSLGALPGLLQMDQA